MAQPRLLISQPLERSEENCSCPSFLLGYAVAPRAPADWPWQVAPDLYHAPASPDHELYFNLVGAANVVVLDMAAQSLLNAFSQPRARDQVDGVAGLGRDEERMLVQQLVDLGLIVPAGLPAPQVHTQKRTLTAWLHVTNACNLHCAYCYIRKSDQSMDEATGRRAVDAVFRSARRQDFGSVYFKYAGGEATLNYGLVTRLHQYASELASVSGIGLSGVVLSNGIALTPGMIEHMRNNGLRLMISLDGLGEVHDSQRSFINGKGSFVQVARGIERAIAHGLPPDLSITVTGRNAAHLAEVVQFALDHELRFNLCFYRENECSASSADLTNDQDRMIAGIKAAFAVIAQRLPRQRLIDGMIDRSGFNGPHEYACGAGQTYMVIDPEGNVARCQMEIEHPVTSIIENDPLSVIQLHAHGFENVSVQAKEGCRTCSWRYWCAGGCSLLTYRSHGRSDLLSPYCRVYKSLYPDLLHLEGLRLLKWGSD